MTDERKHDAKAPLILVMKHPGNARVLKDAVAEIGLTAVEASSEADLQAELARMGSSRSALVDVSGFGDTVWKLCDLLQRHNVPFVVLSTPQDTAASSRSLTYGATSVLQKPVAKAALLQLVRDIAAK